MYRLNPATNDRWHKGEVREDGKVFVSYTKTRPTKDGYYRLCFSDPDKLKSARRQSNINRYKRNQEWLNSIKKSMGGCVDCGFDGHPAALDFDHLPGSEKLFNIGQQKFRSQKQLKEEIAKCELVCANCHRIRTVTRSAQNGSGQNQFSTV